MSLSVPRRLPPPRGRARESGTFQVWAPVLEGNPRFLLLDEPVSSLDIKHQLTIMRIAREFADRGGGTVAILHDLNLASMFSDRIYVMHRGRIAC